MAAIGRALCVLLSFAAARLQEKGTWSCILALAIGGFGLNATDPDTQRFLLTASTGLAGLTGILVKEERKQGVLPGQDDPHDAQGRP